MHSFFTDQFFVHNREELLAALPSGSVVVLTANGHMQRNADEAYKFVQDSNFWYLTGLNDPELTLVLSARSTYLIVPVVSTERQAFDGTYDLEAIAARSGITSLVGERAGWDNLRTLLQSQNSVATLLSPPSYLPRHRLHSLPYRRRLIARLKRLKPSLQFTDIRPQLANMRMYKQPVELQALQAAIDITTQTLSDIASDGTIRAASHEYEIEAAISYGFRHRGASGHAFDPIVGAGQHSTTLHHVDNNGPMAPGDLVVLDIGASVEHYAADITRTVAWSGELTP